MNQYVLKNIDRLCDAVRDSGIHVFIINGAPRSGKDTLVDMFEEYLNMRLDNFSTVDFVKDIAARYGGWDGRKTPKDRKFLSDLKDLFTEWNDIPFADVVERIIQRIDEYEAFGLDLQSRIVLIKEFFLLIVVNHKKFKSLKIDLVQRLFLCVEMKQKVKNNQIMLTRKCQIMSMIILLKIMAQSRIY